jgi:hypothetical protein
MVSDLEVSLEISILNFLIPPWEDKGPGRGRGEGLIAALSRNGWAGRHLALAPAIKRREQQEKQNYITFFRTI